MSEIVIEVKDLRKEYRVRGKVESLLAVGGVSFNVEKGELFGILGPNGAGKTTTLEIMECLKKQTSGSVTVLGFDNLLQYAEIKKRIGVQLQASSYLQSITLQELLELFASLYGTTVDAKQLLSFVGLEAKLTEVVQKLSGGQQQRFTIAASLVHKPEVLFLDEPTTGLDPRARHDIWHLVKEINSQGVTVVLTTHYMEEAEYLCGRVAIMDHGKILTIDNPRTLINQLAHTTQLSFFTDNAKSQDFWRALPDVEKVYSNYPKVILEITSLDAISKILESMRRHAVVFTGFTVRTATLEDVYLDLTGKELGVEHTN